MEKNNFSENIVNTKEVWCNGIFSYAVSSSLGHPKIYLKIGPSNEIKCPYCSHKFIYKNKTLKTNV